MNVSRRIFFRIEEFNETPPFKSNAILKHCCSAVIYIYNKAIYVCVCVCVCVCVWERERGGGERGKINPTVYKCKLWKTVLIFFFKWNIKQLHCPDNGHMNWSVGNFYKKNASFEYYVFLIYIYIYIYIYRLVAWKFNLYCHTISIWLWHRGTT